MQRYLSAVTDNYPQMEQDKEWERYTTALLGFGIATSCLTFFLWQQHYGTAKRNEFEYAIQPQFVKLHFCLGSLASSVAQALFFV